MKNDEIWRNYFDVVILPPRNVRDHAIALSKKLEKHGGKFVLGNLRYIPHISLYHIPVRKNDFEEFREEVRKLSVSSKGGELKLSGIDMPLLMTSRPPWLKKLHRDVVKRTIKYFDWKYGAQDTWRMELFASNLKVRAKGYLENYGSPMIESLFNPHLTLTIFEDNAAPKDIPPLKFEPMSFHVDNITICELGPSHSCQRIIETHSLSSARRVHLTGSPR